MKECGIICLAYPLSRKLDGNGGSMRRSGGYGEMGKGELGEVQN
jgi:hypothetical protein